MHRVPDLVDVWFDSGAMPYAQWGLPDTSSGKYGPLSTENFWQYHADTDMGGNAKAAFPADFIAEGVDPVSYTHLDVYKRQVKSLGVETTVFKQFPTVVQHDTYTPVQISQFLEAAL